jgi:hypothetical protein
VIASFLQLDGRKTVKHTSFVAALVALSAPLAWAQTAEKSTSLLPGGLLAYATAGTSGLGLGLGTQVAEKLNLRVEATNYSANVNDTNDDLSIRGKLKLESAGLYGDYFPFAGAFRITGGVMFKSPSGSVTATPVTGTTATIGNVVYTFDANENVSGTIKYPSTMGYLGVGWGLGKLKEKGFKVGFDLGAGFGSLKSSLKASDGLKNAAANVGKDITADLAAEEKKLNDQLNKVNFFPVIKLSLGYAF